MSLELCVLGSGSGGNSTLVRTAAGHMLIDCGFGPRTTAGRLSGTAVGVGDIAAICVTHFDHDHFNHNWLHTIVKHGIQIYCDAARINILEHHERLGGPKVRGLMKLVHGFACGRRFSPLGDVEMEPLHFPHDEAGSHGFLLECAGHKVGYATDLGRVPAELIELFAGVGILAIESNYDREMEENSSRPYYLKQRIMSGAGHLSNEQAFAAVRKILDRSIELGHGRPHHVVLLHRSRECNCPRLLRRVFERDARLKKILTLTQQQERTAWISARPKERFVGEQLALAW